jgi:hypothetical protein
MKNLALFIFWLLIFTGFKTFGQVNTISDTHTKITISKTIHTFQTTVPVLVFRSALNLLQ